MTNQNESLPIPITDNMGRQIFWENNTNSDYPNLAAKIFSEICCKECSCKNGK